MGATRAVVIYDNDKKDVDDIEICLQMLSMEGVFVPTLEKFNAALTDHKPVACIVRFRTRDTKQLLATKAKFPQESTNPIWIAIYEPNEENELKAHTSKYKFCEKLPLEFPAFPHKLQEAIGGAETGSRSIDKPGPTNEMNRAILRQLQEEVLEPKPTQERASAPLQGFNSNLMLIQALQMSIADELRQDARLANGDPELLPKMLEAATEKVLDSKQVLSFLAMVGENRRGKSK